MNPRVFLDVDPRTLRLPNSRRTGADPFKLQRQIAAFGNSVQGMPPLEVSRGSDGALVLNNGVTRATRTAMLLPRRLRPGRGHRRPPRPRGIVPVDRRLDPMNASATDELVGVLTELRSLFPDWRLGQLVANLTLAAGRDGDGGVWEVEDEQLLTAARRLIERNSARQDS